MAGKTRWQRLQDLLVKVSHAQSQLRMFVDSALTVQGIRIDAAAQRQLVWCRQSLRELDFDRNPGVEVEKRSALRNSLEDSLVALGVLIGQLDCRDRGSD